MYRSGFNSAFVEKRPVSVPSHSSGPVSSLPRGHHTCRLLLTSNSHTGTCLAALGEAESVEGDSEVHRGEEERDQRRLHGRKKGFGRRWTGGN